MTNSCDKQIKNIGRKIEILKKLVVTLGLKISGFSLILTFEYHKLLPQVQRFLVEIKNHNIGFKTGERYLIEKSVI